MHKCFRCGTEFEGGYCPQCGTQWQEQKYCPQCWAVLAGSAKFCNNCGYSFVESEATKKKKSGKGSGFFSKAWAWIKSRLKIVIPTACALVVLIVMLALIPTFITMSVNGTYYLSRAGEISEDEFITLKSGKWKDEEGSTGTYSLSGKKITFHYSNDELGDLGDLFGEDFGDMQLKGTVKNGVLTVIEDEQETVYITKSHKHKFGEWKTVYEPTCTSEGLQRQLCDCRKAKTEKMAVIPHVYDWQTTKEATCTEEGEKKIACTTCGDLQTPEVGEPISATGHEIVSGICNRCTYTQLKYELNEDETAYIVTGFNEGISDTTDAFILSVYKGKPVTRIEGRAFYDCYWLTSITIPNSVTEIGPNAFNYYSKLIQIENGVQYVDKWAIGYSTSNESEEGDIGYDERLTSVTLRSDTVGIGDWAFGGCDSLTSITIPNSVKSIGDGAFGICRSLTSITIPNGITSIGKQTFAFSGLTSVTIPNSVTSIGELAFQECSLTSITIPNSVTNIGDGAFKDCSLTSVTIPNSVTSIGKEVFDGCGRLTSVTIPNSVTSVGEWAFYGCRSLTSIQFEGTKAEWKAIEKHDSWSPASIYTVQCTDGKLDRNGNEIE